MGTRICQAKAYTDADINGICSETSMSPSFVGDITYENIFSVDCVLFEF